MSITDETLYKAMVQFRDAVFDLIDRVSFSLSVQEKKELLHLIEHNESGVALETLAWMIVEEQKRVPKDIIEDILRLGHGIIDHDHMPNNLKSFAV